MVQPIRHKAENHMLIRSQRITRKTEPMKYYASLSKKKKLKITKNKTH